MDESTGQITFTFHKKLEKDVSVYFSANPGAELTKILATMQPDKVFVVCDTRIDELYATQFCESLANHFDVHKIVHKPDEANKKLGTIMKISDSFFEQGGTSKSCICALGGGITGNMAGLFATLAFRGIRLIHIPTTFLAQVDSAADVKQSVNSSLMKNSIGAYKAPDAVIVSPTFLTSLNDREIRAGLGEAVKHGFAQDMDFVQYITSCDSRNAETQQYIAKKTISLKINHWKHTPTIWNDPHKVERLTHLGHTTGKILEMINVDYLTHGEAIAHGMVIEARMSYLLGYLDLPSVKKIYKTLSKLKLLYPLDKKYESKKIVSQLYEVGGEPIFALLRELGNPNTISTVVPEEIVRASLDWYFKKSGTNTKDKPSR